VTTPEHLRRHQVVEAYWAGRLITWLDYISIPQANKTLQVVEAYWAGRLVTGLRLTRRATLQSCHPALEGERDPTFSVRDWCARARSGERLGCGAVGLGLRIHRRLHCRLHCRLHARQAVGLWRQAAALRAVGAAAVGLFDGYAERLGCAVRLLFTAARWITG